MHRTGWLAIGSIAGALVALGLGGYLALLWVIGAASAAAALAALQLRSGSGQARLAIVGLSVGLALVVLRAALGGAIESGAQQSVDGPVGTRHMALVLSVGTPEGGLQRAVVRLEPPEPPDAVYVWLPRYPAIVETDLIFFDGRLEDPPQSGDFADYLARSGISHTARARTMELRGADGSPASALEGLRRTAAELITHALPEPQAGLATAMAIGLRDVVARDVSNDFRTAGLSHVVAISGWHISMLGAVFAALLGGLARRPRSLLVAIAIFGYALLAGASPGVLRAAVMASFVLVARESGRRGQASAALALTCSAMLLVDPATVSDAGFQLSVVATAGLLAWASPLHGWLAARLPRQLPSWLVEALSVSLAAQAATLPLVLLEFGRLSLVAPLANLLIAPLVAPAMLLTAVCFVAGAAVTLGVPGLLLAPISLIGSIGIGLMIAIAHLCASLPLASIELPEPLNMLGAALSATALAVLVVRGRRRRESAAEPMGKRARPRRRWLTPARLVFVGALAALSLMLAVVVAARPDGRLHVTVLDIGQGDAILLQGADGGRMMIDTGPDPDRLVALLDTRIPPWDRRIDLVVLTHPHEDHVAGLALLLRRYRIGAVAESGMVGPGPGDAAYRRQLADDGRRTQILAAGDELWLDGARLHVDWPLPRTVPLRAPNDGKSINNQSIVIDLSYGQRRMLFTGDAEEEIDPQLLAAGLAGRIGRLDVLKVAHHGSRTATTEALLAALSPRVAVVSVGEGNTYGHPSAATLERLSEHGARVFRTDLDGTVDISTDGLDLAVSTARSRLAVETLPTMTRLTTPDVPVLAERGSSGPTYNRRSVRPVARRGRRHRAQHVAVRQAAAPFRGRGRGGRVPVRSDGRPRH